jgi:hypothetical protein
LLKQVPINHIQVIYSFGINDVVGDDD